MNHRGICVAYTHIFTLKWTHVKCPSRFRFLFWQCGLVLRVERTDSSRFGLMEFGPFVFWSTDCSIGESAGLGSMGVYWRLPLNRIELYDGERKSMRKMVRKKKLFCFNAPSLNRRLLRRLLTRRRLSDDCGHFYKKNWTLWFLIGLKEKIHAPSEVTVGFWIEM